MGRKSTCREGLIVVCRSNILTIIVRGDKVQLFFYIEICEELRYNFDIEYDQQSEIIIEND